MVNVWLVDYTNGVDRFDRLNVATISATVTAVTKAANAQVTTSVPHKLSVGDGVHFYGLGGMTQLNGVVNYDNRTGKNTSPTRVASVISDYIFTIDEDTTSYSTYTSGGSVYSVGAKRMYPGELTIEGHGLSNGQIIYVSGIAGATSYNGIYYKVSDKTTNCFRLKELGGTYFDGSTAGGYTGGGTVALTHRIVTGITNANPAVVTCTSHGFSNGEEVYFQEGDTGMTEVAGKTYTVANVTTDTFELSGVDSSAWGTFTTSAKVTWIRKSTSGTSAHYNLFYDMDDGDTVLVREAGTKTHYTSANCTWTHNSNLVNTSSSLVGSIAVGDFVSRQEMCGNGALETAYQVQAISSTVITLRSKYAGTTGTDTSSIWKIQPQATGINGYPIVSLSTYSGTISGGYVFEDDTVPAQTGETWIKHAGSQSTSTNNGIASSGLNIDHFCITNCYRIFYLTGLGQYLSDCTAIYSQLYCYDIGQDNCILTNLMGNGTASQSYGPMYLTTSQGHTFDNVNLISYNSNAAGALYCNESYGYNDLDGVTCYCSGYGLIPSSSNQVYLNLKTVSCYYGVFISSSGNNCTMVNFEHENCTQNGFYISQINSGNVIGATFTGTFPSNGFYLVQVNGLIIEECEFGSCGRNVYLDQYSGNIWLRNNNHGSPGTGGVDKAGLSSVVYIQGDYIDAGSKSKAFIIPAGTSYNEPEYSIINSFDVTGKFYQNHHITQVPGNPPYLEFQYNSAVNPGNVDYPVISQYVKKGESVTINFEISRNSTTAFSGSFTPIIRLNGLPITTGVTGNSAITSISAFDTWDSKSISIDSGQITRDGELTIGFKFDKNSNNIPIWVRTNP